MKKWMYVLLTIAIIGLGGCQTQMNNEEAQKPSEMNPEDLPNVRAFQDEFTLEFLQSTEQTREGYYPFLSGTGKYEMDFPAGGIIGEKGYSLENEGFESYLIGVVLENGEMQINMSYHNIREEAERHLNRIESRIGEDLNFENNDLEDKTIYFTEYYLDNEDYYFVAYIQNKNDIGGVEMRFTIHKDDSDKNDNLNEVKSIIESVNFINDEQKVNGE